MNNLVIMKEQQAVTTSLQVAEGFDKRHTHVIEAIENKIYSAGNSAQYKDMFTEGSYQDKSGKSNKLYYMNRDGFSFIAFGFTGSKADEFKLKYINAFNQMENHIKQQLDTSQLSPELQMFNQMFNALASQEVKTKQLENKVDGISDLISMDAKDWRKEATTILRKIAFKQGGHDQYSEVANDSYIRLESKGRCNLNLRLENRRKNMIAQGMGRTAVSKLNKLDIIQDDHRLKEIYMQVIKDMAIKYGIWEESY